jgi:hypothetical protein
MSFERVSPPQVNYDNVLPLAVESRSNRREFLPVNGQSFSNSNGATVIRIDVNADSMLDPTHSYLECDLKSDSAATTFMGVNPFCPSWIQRLRIESGGVVIEDINEYSRLYAMLVLNQTPQEYVKNNMNNMGMYNPIVGGNLKATSVGSDGAVVGGSQHHGGLTSTGDAETIVPRNICGNLDTELYYPPSAQAVINGVQVAVDNGAITDTSGATGNQPTTSGLDVIQAKSRIKGGQARKMCIPLVSGWLNMDRYIPLIMLNAGFTIELTLCDANRIGITQTETAGTQGALSDSAWTVSGVKYVAHLIDMERDFYDRLRLVMDDAGGTLQLAGQTYRHYTGNLPAGEGTTYDHTYQHELSLLSLFSGLLLIPLRWVQLIHATTLLYSSQRNISKYRFEIGSVRYPQTDVAAGSG